MGSIFGKLGYSGNIGPYRAKGPGEMAFDKCEDNIDNHHNEQAKFRLKAQVTGEGYYKPNGGMCNDVNQGPGK